MAFSIWDLTSGGLISVALGCIVFILIRIWLTSTSKKYNLPPGPRPYPLIGNLLNFINVKEIIPALLKLKAIYGNAFTVHIGPFPFVFITDLPTIREGLVKKGEYTKGRANWIYWIKKLFHKQGVIFSTGQVWKDLRRFTLTTLRDLGMGKKGIEDKIHEEITEVNKAIELTRGRPFYLKKPIGDAVINIIYNIIFGQRLEYDDPDFEEIYSIFNFLFKNGSNVLIENFLPWVEYIPLKTTAKTLLANDNKLKKYIYQKIQEHRQTFDENNIRDFVDMYLLIIKKESKESFSEQNIFRTIVDIFVAGSETTATTLLWVFLYITKYPDVQNKCRQEIIKVTEMNRMVRMEDKKDMPYSCATIFEVQRMASVLPSTIPHVAEEDITLGGYDIPKGTIIQFMIEAAHKDPKYWKDPNEFNPSRWLDEEGKLKQNEAFLPFSLGPRNCLGEPLARMELFLFFTNLVQRFEFLSDEHQPVSVSGSITGITYQPECTRICARLVKDD